MITSKSNPKIKEVRLLRQAKHRDERGEYIVEGVRLVEELFEEKEFVRKILYSPRLEGTARGIQWISSAREKMPGAEWLYVDDEVLASISDTQNHQGILVVLKKRAWTWKDIEQRKGLILCFYELQDPGNLGTIFRVVEAGGGGGIILTSGSVDPFSPKVVRASMGSFFRVPFMIRQPLETLPQELQSRGYRVWATAASAQPSFWGFDFSSPAAILFGQEGSGIPEEWTSRVDGTLKIPMAPKIDSLNVAMAAGLVVYEAFRQKCFGSQVKT